MVTISGKRDQVLLDGKNIREAVTIKDCVNCTIKNCDFQYDKSDTTLLTLSNCQKCVISGNKFHDKSTKGLFVKIMGSKSEGNVFEDNELWNHTFSAENGGEPMRVGNSDVSGCNFNTIIKNNSFHDLRSDVETISIKSCGNVIENNEFENNASMITVRHGGYNKIINNRFKGKGGIRLLGAGNEVTGNYFEENHDSKWIPIRIEYGNVERDPNFTSDNKPSGKGGESHAKYARVVENKISDNKFVDCTNTVKIDDRGRSLAPKDIVNQNNVPVKPGDAPKPPTTTTPEEELPEPEPEQEPEVVVTPEPVETAPQPTKSSGSLYDWWKRVWGGGPAAKPPVTEQKPPTTTTTATPPPTTTTPPTTTEETLDTIGNKIHVLVNQERKKNGVAELQYDERLEGIAANHSKDMGVRNFFAHVTPEGYDVGKRYAHANYSGCRAYGENIAWFETSRLSSMTYDEIAQKMFGQWLNSPPHHDNMLRSIYTVEGIGVYVKGNRIFGTEDFCGR